MPKLITITNATTIIVKSSPIKILCFLSKPFLSFIILWVERFKILKIGSGFKS